MAEPATIASLHADLAAKKVSAVEVIEQSLAAIKQTDGKLHAWLEVAGEGAHAQAQEIDAKGMAVSGAKPLAGITIGIKDVICTSEGRTSAASKILERFHSPYEATAIKKLKAAGAVIVGKTNLDEFAMGSSNEYSAYGSAVNPWDATRVPGGSSGGSAVAVAAGHVPGALGTETGGSVRLPASFCNVVGVKPTYGRVSRFGVIAYGSSLDQIGPVARTVGDAALLLEIISGQDASDATSSPEPVPQYSKLLAGEIKGVRIGVPKEFFAAGIVPEVETAIRAAIAELGKQGAEIKEVSLPLTPLAVAVYYLIAKAEASSNLARYDGLRFSPMNVSADSLLEYYKGVRSQGFGPEVKRAILMGTYALSAGYADAWYKQASKVRTLIQREYEEVFRDVDLLAAPVSAEVAFPLGSKADDPLAMYLADALTVPVNIAGIPALSVPCGFVDGLPVGLQLMAPHWQETRLFQVAHAYEQSQEWWRATPSL
jgi:aspartyl-tRNA(Asn)/glutamyl-tRNA(Gln) amidotransferase subunit A